MLRYSQFPWVTQRDETLALDRKVIIILAKSGYFSGRKLSCSGQEKDQKYSVLPEVKG
jgi:hypothetical protein